MYSRNYPADELKIPDNYDGTSLFEPKIKEDIPTSAHIEIPKTEIKFSPSNTNIDKKDDAEEEFAPAVSQKTQYFDPLSILRSFTLKNISHDILIPNLGSEELLLLAIALFLFLSKNGDRICALLIVALVFIK